MGGLRAFTCFNCKNEAELSKYALKQSRQKHNGKELCGECQSVVSLAAFQNVSKGQNR